MIFMFFACCLVTQEKSLYSKDNIKKFNAIEIKEFKKMYLKIRRKICHNKMTHHLPHHVAEAILREYVSFEEMLVLFLNTTNFYSIEQIVSKTFQSYVLQIYNDAKPLF